MARYIRNTVLLAKAEGTYGTDPTPTGLANALLVSNVSIDLAYNNADRDLIRGYYGSSEQLAGTRSVNLGFDVELAGSGDAGLTAPAWGPLLKACGFAESDAGAYYEYTPISTAIPSVTFYYYLDGALHKVLGARGTASFNMGIGQRPVMSFRFTGLDGGLTAAANATPTLTAFQKPVVVTDTNTSELVLGGSYAAGAISGGTAYTSQGLSLDLGNDVVYTPLIGEESVDLTNRNVSGTLSLDLTAAAQVTAKTAVDANTTTTLGFTHGTVAGNILVFYAPVVQRTNPRLNDVNSRALMGYDLRLLPSTGNDELKIVVK